MNNAAACRLTVLLCEGQTEEQFVNQVLVEPILYSSGALALQPRVLVTREAKGGRPAAHGGVGWSFAIIDRNLRVLAKQQHLHGVSTMIDLYRFPADWKDYVDEALARLALAERDPATRASMIERAIQQKYAPLFSHGVTFEPFLLVYEFEALLFSDPTKFVSTEAEDGLFFAMSEADNRKLVGAVTAIRDAFTTPERINNSDPPGKRLEEAFEQVGERYNKPYCGVRLAQRMTLPKIRRECARFGKWVEWLEAGATGAATWR
jgi:hypothetical protein